MISLRNQSKEGGVVQSLKGNEIRPQTIVNV
jgi:hypothetical protein